MDRALRGSRGRRPGIPPPTRKDVNRKETLRAIQGAEEASQRRCGGQHVGCPGRGDEKVAAV